MSIKLVMPSNLIGRIRSRLKVNFLGGPVVKNLPANAGDIRNTDSILGSGRSPGGEHGNPLQYSCLENPMDRGAWRATVHRVSQSQTRLKGLSTQGYTHSVTHDSQWGAHGLEQSTSALLTPFLGLRNGACFLPNVVSFFFNRKEAMHFYLFTCFWSSWVFVAVQGLSLVAVSRGYCWLWCGGFSCCRAQALGFQ